MGILETIVIGLLASIWGLFMLVFSIRSIWLFRQNIDPILFVQPASIKKSWYQEYEENKARLEDILTLS